MPANSKTITQGDYVKLRANSNLNYDRDVESFTADPRAGRVGVVMNNGYVADFDYNDLKKSSATGKIDDEIKKRLKQTNNPIELISN